MAHLELAELQFGLGGISTPPCPTKDKTTARDEVGMR